MARPQTLAPTLGDLLTRARATGLPDSRIQEAAGLPAGWLARAARGERTSEAPGWVKLREWLARYEAKALPPGTRPSAAADPPPKGGDPEKLGPLLAAVRDATTHRKIGRALEALAVEVLLGTVDGRTAERLESTLKARQRSLREERLERGMAKVSALRVLLPDEVELLERRRAAVATPPLAPGEKPPPPDEAPERVVTTCPTCNGASVLVEVRPRAPSPPAAAP